jgi:hypothetical protein
MNATPTPPFRVLLVGKDRAIRLKGEYETMVEAERGLAEPWPKGAIYAGVIQQRQRSGIWINIGKRFAKKVTTGEGMSDMARTLMRLEPECRLTLAARLIAGEYDPTTTEGEA